MERDREAREVARIRATAEEHRALRVAAAAEDARGVAAWLLRVGLIVARAGLRLDELRAALREGGEG